MANSGFWKLSFSAPTWKQDLKTWLQVQHDSKRFWKSPSKCKGVILEEHEFSYLLLQNNKEILQADIILSSELSLSPIKLLMMLFIDSTS